MMIEINGKKIDDGTTVSVDHVVQTFTVVVRSLNGVSESGIKDLIQRKWEVVRIEGTGHDIYVRAGAEDIFDG